ncbi:hypothetical protein L7F22_030933 [Adiantum nelumboides]|nr:hypothetical protein [Adiantum nelumboides]
MKKKRLKRSDMQDARSSVGLANTAADQSRRRRGVASRAVRHQYYGTRAPAIAGVKICSTFDRTIVASEAGPAGSLLKELEPPPAAIVGHAGTDQQAEGRRPQHMVHEGEVEQLQAGFSPSTPPAAHTFTDSESCYCDRTNSNYTINEKLINACMQLGMPPAQRNVDSHDQQVAIACHACATPTPYIDQYRVSTRLHTADDILSEINGHGILQECIKCAACNHTRYGARAGSTTQQVNPHGSQLPPPAPRKPKAQPRRSWIHRPSFFIPPDLELFFSSIAQPHNRISTLMSD